MRQRERDGTVVVDLRFSATGQNTTCALQHYIIFGRRALTVAMVVAVQSFCTVSRKNTNRQKAKGKMNQIHSMVSLSSVLAQWHVLHIQFNSIHITWPCCATLLLLLLAVVYITFMYFSLETLAHIRLFASTFFFSSLENFISFLFFFQCKFAKMNQNQAKTDGYQTDIGGFYFLFLNGCSCCVKPTLACGTIT